MAEAIDVTGLWYLNSWEAEGTTYSASESGHYMMMHMFEDGTAFLLFEGEAVGVYDDASGMMAVEDGCLVMIEDDMKMIFTREAPASSFVHLRSWQSRTPPLWTAPGTPA